MEKLLISLVKQDRKSIARKTLYFFHSVFRYASDHKLILENVTSHLTIEKNAGGDPQERQIFLSESEIEKVVTETIEKVGAEGMKDMGKVMGELKSRYTGQMDFGKVGPLVKGKLA